MSLINKNTISNFMELFFDSTAKSIDRLDYVKDWIENDELLSTIPLGRVAKYFIEKAIKIDDLNPSFQNAIALSYFVTVVDVLREFGLELRKFNQDSLKELIEKTKEYEAKGFSISNFYENKIIDFYKGEYEEVLKTIVFDKDLDIVQKRVDELLKINFYKTLEDGKKTYEVFINYLNSDRFKEEHILYRKDVYKSKIESEYFDIVMQDEKGLTLADIYIEPKFKVYYECLKNSDSEKKDNDGFVDMGGDLHNFIHNFINRDESKLIELKNINQSVAFIFGYPGQGKSSFCKRLVNDTISQKKPIKENIYFVKLRRLRELDKLITYPLKVIKNELKESEDLEIENFKNSLLILDGLDELYMRNNFTTKEIEEFCRQLIKDSEDMKIIITSRYGYIDYHKLDEDRVLTLKIDNLTEESQLNWLQRYKRFHPEIELNEEKIREINETNNHLKELIGQPILLHMIANIKYNEIDLNANRAFIYEKVIDSIITRKWDSEKHENLSGIKPKDLEKLLSAVALKIFHSENEYIHKKTLLELPQTKKFYEKLNNKEAFEDSIKGVMIAFYFQEVKRDKNDSYEEDRDNYAIEFLHKSLQEYLSAKEIFNTLLEFTDISPRTDEFVVNDYKQALEIIFNLFSKRTITDEIKSYLIEIIENSDYEIRKILSDRLEKFFINFLKRDFLYEYNISDENPMQKGFNTFYGYWHILSHLLNGKDKKEKLDNKKDYLSNLNENSKRKFIFFLRNLINTNNVNLSYLNFENLYLSFINLYGANLFNADLSNADLFQANLFNADLSNADLSSADLENANLSNADLFQANLFNADLSSADLENANLSNADLSNADLENANLSNADLSNADLENANLSNANLSNANIIDEQLKEAINTENIIR